ncbi:MAG TPA: UDP-3-O-(3-hydroxymyristoyl)glucosamine N-acyltransferase [Chthoniobacteraceae bacterium]|jgi:UDP-3-O-[3-hydroxymyristoyl] glucosamine N-acyltransferase|nr:UDP-3-O-(3-hydroxymyristoyl)glucosamine N-acyltransferase [Chthoniobacteraceae bacterium]
MTLADLAQLTNATLAPEAVAEGRISGAAALDDAGPEEVAFFVHPKYLGALRRTKAAAAFVPLDFAGEASTVLLRVADPSMSFALAIKHLTPAQEPYAPGIHPTAVVGENVKIDPTASIQPFAVIEAGTSIGARTVVGAHSFVGRGSRLGEDCLMHPNATLREGSILGNRVIVHSAAVIGSDGFGYGFVAGHHVKIPQVGFVQLDDDVEIGAGTTIDRARFGRTWIQEGTKIDNLVQIAHNVVIGPRCLILSQTGISGSTTLGRYVTLAGQVGVVGHVTVGDQVVVAAKSGVSKDTPAHARLMGMIGYPMAEERKLMVHYRQQPKTLARLKILEAEMMELKAEIQRQRNGALNGAA